MTLTDSEVTPIPTERLNDIATLSRIVRNPTRGPVRQLMFARAFLGLLILTLTAQGLSADFTAIAYLARISGKTDSVASTRRLRRFLAKLVPSVVSVRKIDYDTKRTATDQRKRLTRVPVKGVICLGGMVRVVMKPRGQKLSLYFLNIPKQATSMTNAFRRVLRSHVPCPERISAAQSEIRSVMSSLHELIEDNQIWEISFDPIVERLTDQDIQNVAYLLACFEKSRRIEKRLQAIIPLFPIEI